jgi:hypothetical protein
MTTHTKDLWQLVSGQPHIDPHELAEAVQEQARQDPLDYRTRLLIHDSMAALEQHWGRETLKTWLTASTARVRIESILQESFERCGFPFLAERVMKKTDPNEVREFLRELGSQIVQPLPVHFGGSGALILSGYLSRRTDDLDVVDEVPEALRSQHQLLDRLRKRYGLSLAHFQSHYLPSGWEQRLHSLGSFGRLQVFLVDVYDVFLSKLFSKREKDRDDLRVVAPQLDKETVMRRLRETATALASDPDLRLAAEQNWYVLYGEPLPS